jgi:hypothetical protein
MSGETGNLVVKVDAKENVGGKTDGGQYRVASGLVSGMANQVTRVSQTCSSYPK